MLRRVLAVWAALPFFALGAAGLSVDSLSPDALCPPLEETRQAVAARLGSVELEGTWHATYLLVHRTQGDFVSLSLRDPDDVLRLERDLPVQGGSCATLSRVIALVLERFFLRPEQAPEPQPEPQPKASTAPVLAALPERAAMPPPAALTPTPPAPAAVDAAAAAATAPAPQFRASAGLWATTAWLAPSLGLARQLTGAYWLDLNAGFDLNDHETGAFEGSVFVRRVPIGLAFEREFSPSRWASANAAVELLGIVEAARTVGVAQPGGGQRLVPGLGARLGARLFADSAVQPFVELTAAWLVRAATPAFQVGGQEVMPPSALVFGLALGIATPF
jgi:hypothetical protein